MRKLFRHHQLDASHSHPVPPHPAGGEPSPNQRGDQTDFYANAGAKIARSKISSSPALTA